MRSPEIQKLVEAVETTYGPIELYGSIPSEEHGTCFKVAGIPATFSVDTLDGTLPPGRYDVQIDGIPLVSYIYTAEVSLSGFLELLSQMRGPIDEWPLEAGPIGDP